MAGFFDDIRDASRGIPVGMWTRRALLVVLAVLPVLALVNLLGQEPADSRAEVSSARLGLSAPERVRGGLLFQSRIEVRALSDLRYPRLVLDRGWVEGMQISSIEPEPQSEASRDGRIVLSYDELKAGDRLVVWVQSQVDPTNPGRRPYGLALDDQARQVAAIHRTITVLP